MKFSWFCCLFSVWVWPAFGRRYDGYKLVRLRPENEVHLRIIRDLSSKHENHVNFWSDPQSVAQPVDVAVSPTRYNAVLEHLSNNQIGSDVLVEDLQRIIDNEANGVSSGVAKIDNFTRFQLDRYHSYETINDFLRIANIEFPFLTQLIPIGNSTQKRKLTVIKIGKPSNSPKPTVWIDAGIHAREWIAPATAIYIIHRLLTSYNNNTQIQSLVDKLDWYILPLANPDGYEFSRAQDRMWRKTRSLHQCSFWSCCYGTDPNRNFGYHWGGEGTSNNPCSEIYRGTEPFSEPETKAISNFVLANNKTMGAFMSIHSYSQMWLLPFGYSEPATYPKDYPDMLNLARMAAEKLTDVHATPYTVGNSADVLYAASGASDDWAKGAAGIKYVYTLELRPSDKITDDLAGFILSADQIISTGEETFAGITVVAEQVIKEFQENRARL